MNDNNPVELPIWAQPPWTVEKLIAWVKVGLMVNEKLGDTRDEVWRERHERHARRFRALLVALEVVPRDLKVDE